MLNASEASSNNDSAGLIRDRSTLLTIQQESTTRPGVGLWLIMFGFKNRHNKNQIFCYTINNTIAFECHLAVGTICVVLTGFEAKRLLG